MKGLLNQHTLTGLAIALSAIIGSGRADARRLSPGEARQRVAAAIQQSPNTRPGGSLKSPGNVAAALTLSYTSAEVGAENVPAFYVFNVASRSNNAGFVIASGDDRLRPVLAIADQGTFDSTNIPANVAWWLGQYEQEIAAYLDSPAAKSADSAEELEDSAAESEENAANSPLDNYVKWSTVAPLLSTRWDQGEPYNYDAPMHDGRRSVTGCVATAVAQIVKFHELTPPTGNGIKSYTSTEIGQTVSYDFNEPYFDWSNMLDSYSSGYTSEQAAAVANLMKACGIAVDMQYSPSASGAFSTAVPKALTTYFGFDKNTVLKLRGNYSTTEWESLIYNELSHRRPIYYSGASPGGAHAFVCDGYDQDGLFHINWGWGGYCDGYFSLSALNPDGQGIGGYAGGYNIGQTVVLCFPPMAEDIPDVPDYIFDQNSDFTSNGVSNNGDQFNCGFSYSRALQEPAEFYMAVGIEGSDGSLSVARDANLISLPNGYFYTSYTYTADVKALNLPAGKYRVFPMASVKQPDGTYNDYELTSMTFAHELTMSVSASGNRSYRKVTADSKPKIEVLEFKALNDWYTDAKDNAFSLILTNSGDVDYQNTIAYMISNTEVGKTGIILPPDEIRHFNHTFTIPESLTGKSRLTVEVWESVQGQYKKLCKTTLSVPVIKGSRPSGSEATPASASISVSEPYLKRYDEMIVVKANFKESMSVSARLYKQGTNIIVSKQSGAWSVAAGAESNLAAIFPQPSSGAVGLYDLALYNVNTGEDISNRVTLSFGGEIRGLAYNPIIGDNGVRLTAYNGTGSSLTISKKVAGKEIHELGAGFLMHNKDIEMLEIPETVTGIGEDALRFTSNLKALFIGNPQVLHPAYPQLVMYGTNPNLDIYVPEATYDECLGTKLANTYNFYKRITEFTPAESAVTLGVGDVSDVTIATVPATEVNTGLTLEVADEGIATATAQDGTVSIQGIAEGETTITVTSAQPRVPAATITVNVSGISAVHSATVQGETSVIANGRTIAVRTADSHAAVAVYTASGSLVAVRSGSCDIPVAGESLYIVKVSEKAFKVAVN